MTDLAIRNVAVNDENIMIAANGGEKAAAKRHQRDGDAVMCTGVADVISEDNVWNKGAVTRIEVKNFMTYDHCVVTPGPKLNLILGPNGSGKSSLVCALCVGLGGATKVIRRKFKFPFFRVNRKSLICYLYSWNI